jgi:replication factor C subunit 2/4
MSSFIDTEEIIQPKRLIPWVEKYRPDKVDDVAHQDEVVKTLKKAIEQGTLPHLMFHGPPGTGKTTTILAVARALYGPDLYKGRILELNASDERGIAVVREKVKTFAQRSVGSQKSNGYPCPRFKIIILDECDSMTPDAQSALRRIMETYSKVTRFCLICNYVTRIIEPLASRCAKFRFKSLPIGSMVSRLTQIADSEGVQLEEGAMNAVMEASDGDMRKAVTFLQSGHQLCDGTRVTSELIIDISGQVPKDIMSNLWIKMDGHSFDMVKNAGITILSLRIYLSIYQPLSFFSILT